MNEIVERIADFISRSSTESVYRVAIDGVDGVGKTTFADTLAKAVESRGRDVIRASVDNFHNPREVRYRRGKTSPRGFFLDSYNYAELRRVLLDPLAPNGSRAYCTAIFDHVANAERPYEWSQAMLGAVLIFDGLFLHRAELIDAWDFSVFLDAPFEITIPRGASRGPDWGSPDVNAASNRRYVCGQRLYLRRCRPQEQANVVIDYSDFNAPRLAGQSSANHRPMAASLTGQCGLDHAK